MPSRNPDKDERPWCYVVKDHALSWEYCHLVACGAQSWGWGRSRVGNGGPTPVEVTEFGPVALPTPHPHIWPLLSGGPLRDGETEAHWGRASPRPCSGLAPVIRGARPVTRSSGWPPPSLSHAGKATRGDEVLAEYTAWELRPWESVRESDPGVGSSVRPAAFWPPCPSL